MKTRKIFYLNVLIFTFISMIFMGCGGGGSGSSPKEYTVGKGTYIDSAVSGISYICGEEKGLTDENGQFTFEVGASCTFFIKDIELRKVGKDALFDKVVIFEDHPKVAQFLQTLDNDGDPSNGITIDPKVIELLGGSLPDSEAELEALVEKILKAAEEDPTLTYTGHVVSAENASKHLEETRRALDETPPVITLLGSSPMTINQGTSFEDPGITAIDDYYDRDEIVITTSGTVDTTTPASYTLTYTATDGASNSAKATRVVKVVDITKPIITLTGDATVSLLVNENYTEQGATCSDNHDDSCSVTVGGDTVSTTSAGTYTITYNAVDASGNHAVEVTRTVVVTLGDSTANYNIAQKNSLHDVNVTFESFRVVVYTDTLVETTSNSTKAVYGNINGNPSNALIQINSNYPDGTAFIVKVFSDGTLVGESQKVILSGASLEFNDITTE